MYYDEKIKKNIHTKTKMIMTTSISSKALKYKRITAKKIAKKVNRTDRWIWI